MFWASLWAEPPRLSPQKIETQTQSDQRKAPEACEKCQAPWTEASEAAGPPGPRRPRQRSLKKRGSLGRQPKTPKGIKLGGCLRKRGCLQEHGVGRINQFWACLAGESCRCKICHPHPTPPLAFRGAISLLPAAAQQNALSLINPKH